MTTKEKVTVIKQIKDLIQNSQSWSIEAKNAAIESLDSSIRSIEAWEKVKEEIKNAKPVYPDRVRIWGTDTILGIIDKHLQEVENDD